MVSVITHKTVLGTIEGGIDEHSQLTDIDVNICDYAERMKAIVDGLEGLDQNIQTMSILMAQQMPELFSSDVQLALELVGLAFRYAFKNFPDEEAGESRFVKPTQEEIELWVDKYGRGHTNLARLVNFFGGYPPGTGLFKKQLAESLGGSVNKWNIALVRAREKDLPFTFARVEPTKEQRDRYEAEGQRGAPYVSYALSRRV
jgi:hypothetical protein